MKIKEGDIFYCRKNKSLFRKDSYPYFSDGKVYVVEEMLLHLMNGGSLRTGILYINNDIGGFNQLLDNELGGLKEIMKTPAEMRKFKLEKLSKNEKR